MSLGLTQKELDALFFRESADYLKRNRGLPKESIAGGYVLNGFNQIQADALADLASKMISSSQAILTVINQNNLEIEKQLKEKEVKL